MAATQLIRQTTVTGIKPAAAIARQHHCQKSTLPQCLTCIFAWLSSATATAACPSSSLSCARCLCLISSFPPPFPLPVPLPLVLFPPLVLSSSCDVCDPSTECAHRQISISLVFSEYHRYYVSTLFFVLSCCAKVHFAVVAARRQGVPHISIARYHHSQRHLRFFCPSLHAGAYQLTVSPDLSSKLPYRRGAQRPILYSCDPSLYHHPIHQLRRTEF